MTLLSLTYKIAEASGVSTQDNKQFQQTAQLNYAAVTDGNPFETTYSVRAQSGLMAGFPHPFIPFMYSSAVNCVKKSQVMFEIIVDYMSRGKPGQSPLDEPPVIEYDFDVSEEAFDQSLSDNQGNIDGGTHPCMFKTNEPPDPPLKDTQYDQKIRVSRNLAWFDPDLFSKYAGKTNSDTFLNFPPGTLRITEPPKAKSAVWNDFTYFQCSIAITIRRGVDGLYPDSQAWFRRVLAAGMYQSVFADATRNMKRIVIRATDGKGKEAVKPVLHDISDGSQLPFDTDGFQDPTKSQWYTWLPKGRAQLPFSVLQIA